MKANPGIINDSTSYMSGLYDDVVTLEYRGIVFDTCDQWYCIDSSEYTQ